MEKLKNNESAADADGYGDTLSENSYASSSGGESDESNTSLLERNSILANKFILPKDLCESDAIFNEFFSTSLWDSLAPSVRQHLTQFLPCANEEKQLSTKVVHDLFSHRLDRFGVDQMATFQHNLAEGNFRTDIAKLRCNLGKSLRKERRMLEVQRMARVAKHLMISRETTLLAELQMNGGISMLPISNPRYGQFGLQNRYHLQSNATHEIEKCRRQAKKRYLSEIFSVSDAAGIPLSLSDEEDCLDAIPSGPVRKQRRMFGISPHISGEHTSFAQRHGAMHGNNAVSGNGNKRGTFHSNNGSMNTTILDGTTFGTSKLFVVTDEHYHKLLLQYRKRKFEEPDHPELDFQGVKLKDVVTRTQLAAGYRRILPLPKVYLPEATINNTAEENEKTKLIKSIKSSRLSCEQDDVKNNVHLDKRLIKKVEAVKVEDLDDNDMLIPKVESGNVEVQSDIKPLTALLCKQEEIDTTQTEDSTEENLGENVCPDQSVEASVNDQTLPADAKEERSGGISLDILIGNDTHACFLSLIRDLFCSNPDHRLTMDDLQLRLEAWSKSSVAARNSWYNEYNSAGCWNLTLQSAVQFLTGEFKRQPEDFVPYIEHKVALNILQWIGASRDGDSRLVPLCAYWQSRKQEMGLVSSGSLSQSASIPTNTQISSIGSSYGTAGSTTGSTALAYPAKGKHKQSVNSKLLLLSSNSSSSSSSSLSSISSITTIGDGNSILAEVPPSSLSLGVGIGGSSQDDDGSVSERSVSPPPPRFPTDWAVRKATEEEMFNFRQQEKRRYENPHMAFTYKQHSYDSVVGPVKGIYTQVPGISKARGHSMLVADRPNFVTILTLVRDATARLPNGEGTRADICELLKSSQYISPTATDQILQTIVSGALDRMHTEHDPCVKYDAKRKIWIYLHRNRTEEEFERLHLQYQGFTKHKKSVTRKAMRVHKENVTSTSGAASESFNAVNLLQEQDSSDLSNSTINNSDVSNVSNSPATNNVPIAASSVLTPTIKPATSLLKKQSTSVLSQLSQLGTSDRKVDETTSGSMSTKKILVGQLEQSKQSLLTQQQKSLLVSNDVTSESVLKVTPKVSGAVTIITSTGSSMKTIKIQKSSLPLANKQTENLTPVENVVPSYITLPQKNLLVSTFVPNAKLSSESSPATVSAVGFANTKLLTDVLRKVPTMPVAVQSPPTSTIPAQTSSTLASNSIEGDKKIPPGSSMLSIRQVTTSAGTTGVSAAKGTSATGNDQPSPVTSPQMLLHTKTLQLPLSNSTIMSSTGNLPNSSAKVSTTMVTVIAPSAKPMFTTSTGSLHSKSLPVSATVLSNSNTSVVAAASGTIPQRVVINTTNAYTPVNSVGPAGITVKATGIVSSISGSTIIPTSTTHRVIRPSANLISTITLAKGQQSVLSQAQQKQILQNLLCQQQKQQMLTAKKIVPTMIASVAPATSDQSSGETRAGESGNQGPAVSMLQDSQRSAGTVSTYKLQHHPNTNQTIKALPPQIVKITPARACAPSTGGSIGMLPNAVNGSTSTMVSSISPVSSQVPSSVRMMKVHQSNIVTPTSGHAMLPEGTHSSGNIVTVSAASGPAATMRVLKTSTGTTTVVKTGVSSPQVISQTTSMQQAAIAKLRREGSMPIVSKVTVTPNVSTGQLIPLESLLQKQGIANTTTNSQSGTAVGSTFLKISGTGKTGQPQLLQFSTNTTAAVSGNQATATVTPISSVSSGGQQYTVVAQNARNIISVASNTTGTRCRPANMPVTIVSSIAPEAANDSLQPVATSHVVGGVGPTSTVTAAPGSTILSHVEPTSKMQQANKIKLFATSGSVNASSVATVGSSQQQQPGTPTGVMNPKASMAATVLGGSGGEFLANAKIIGVRNVTGGKMKPGSSLSIMNAANLNIAHIGGKPIIIANSSALSANPSVTVSTANIGVINNQSNTGAGSGSTMVLASNATYSNVLQMDPATKGKNIVTASSVSGGDDSVTDTIVNSPAGHTQTQTLMLGNQMVRVQTIKAATAAKLAHHKRQTMLSDVSVTSREPNTATNAIISSAGGATVVQQQQQQIPICSSGSATSNVSKTISTPSSIVAGTISKSIVKIQPASSSASMTNATAKVIEMGQPKTQMQQAQQGQRVVLATSSGQLLTQPLILPSGFQSSGPINIKRLKVIPVSKQCKK